ncbi:hypothetical protein HWV23_16580 [Natronomonas halophila]|uniref:hypothetical protein n=1 Tax=Natronomonas halophila TaxID=2747817 RepID=UPI0015B7758B|nr:hypothetical protein [Natronomonas halophila]QLD87268.1 hypothetical protein HWV23_16580 [Natronomonas halophila]
MNLRRRQVLALAATGVAPALAGCSPCGETWTGVGFHVEPTTIERTDGWRVDAQLTVNFNFAREGYGILAPALALFGRDGALLTEVPVDDLTWSDVPEAARKSDDCGEYATVRREATLESDRFPKVVGLRFDEYRTGFDESTTVSTFSDGTPNGEVSPDDYEMVDFESFGVSSDKIEYGSPVQDARFNAGPLICEDRETHAEARTNVHLTFSGQRTLPAEHYHPFLSDLQPDGDRLTATIGLRTAPRFRRGECLRTAWTASVDITEPEAMPSTVEIETLDADGEVSETQVLDVESDTPEP